MSEYLADTEQCCMWCGIPYSATTNGWAYVHDVSETMELPVDVDRQRVFCSENCHSAWQAQKQRH